MNVRARVLKSNQLIPYAHAARRSNHCVAFARRLNQGDQVNSYMESGSGDDCLYETTFFYGQFNVFMYFSEVLP